MHQNADGAVPGPLLRQDLSDLGRRIAAQPPFEKGCVRSSNSLVSGGTLQDLMTAAISTTVELAAPPFRVGNRCGVVVSLIMLVLAFTFAVTFPFYSVAAAGTPAGVEMPVDHGGKLPTERPDYGLIEHGVHCLGHAVVRSPVAFVEPTSIQGVAGPISNQLPLVTASLSPPEKPPRG